MKTLEIARRNLFWLILAAVWLWDVGLVSTQCFSPDWNYTWLWARNIQADGLGLIYAGKPLYNYPPLMAYALWLFAKGFGSASALKTNLYWFKLFPLAFDFVAAAVAVKWAGDRRRELVYLLLLIANPIYIFNSYTWGQIDSTYCVLVFLTLLAMVRDRPVAALLLYTLAFNFKIQALLFAPLFALVLLWKLNNPWSGKRTASAIGAAALLQLVILPPFALAGTLGRMFDILKDPVNYYQAVSMNAFNFWDFFYGINSIKINDSLTTVYGLSAQQIGLALFFGFTLLVLGPIFARALKSRSQGGAGALNEESLLLMFSLIPLGFFFFCTQMHERYSQPALLFLAVYSFRTRRYGLLAVMFLAYGLNVEYVFEDYQLRGWWSLLFDSRFVATLYAVMIAGLLWRYFQSLSGFRTASAAKKFSPHGQAGGAEAFFDLGDGENAKME